MTMAIPRRRSSFHYIVPFKTRCNLSSCHTSNGQYIQASHRVVVASSMRHWTGLALIKRLNLQNGGQYNLEWQKGNTQ